MCDHHSSKHHPIGRVRRPRGFTLIELMIVVAVVAILSAIGYPSYQQFILKSRRADAKNAVLDLASRQERFFSVNNAYTSSAANLGYGTSATFPLAVSVSGTSYYGLTVALTAATGTTPAGFQASATPTGAQIADACFTFQVNQLGVQSNLDSAGTAISNAGCW